MQPKGEFHPSTAPLDDRDRRAALPLPRCYDEYVRRVIARPARRWTAHLATSLLQLPRILVALGLCAAIGSVSLTFTHLGRAGIGELGSLLALALVGLWVAGSLVLLGELIILGLREALAAPWPGSAPTTLGINLRALLSLAALFTAANARFPSEIRIAVLIAIVTTLFIFGWRIPAAARGLRTVLRALRSLSAREPASALGALRGTRGAAQRRLVLGRLSLGEGDVFSLEHEGLTARFQEQNADLVMLATPGLPAAVLARVQVEGEGYRSAGIRLESGGLPVWILDAQGGEKDQLATLRRRLRLAAAFDGGLLACAALGALGLAVFLLCAAFARSSM